MQGMEGVIPKVGELLVTRDERNEGVFVVIEVSTSVRNVAACP